MNNYIINSKGEPEVCEDLMFWAQWMQKENRIICRNYINEKFISTVFLGINHNFNFSKENPRPVLFETMVFNEGGDGQDIYCKRECTVDEAIETHNKVLLKIINCEDIEETTNEPNTNSNSEQVKTDSAES